MLEDVDRVRVPQHDANDETVLEGKDIGAPQKTFAQAAWQILIADVSISLDNVLAVAGAAGEHL